MPPSDPSKLSPFELLRGNNPFMSSCAGDPWSESHPNVESINRPVLDGLLALIRKKTNDPATPLAGLVLGDAGMGKTHFLKRILDAVGREKIRSSFVFLETILNPRTPMRRLLNEIVVNLDKKTGPGGEFSQLDHLLADLKRNFLTLRFRESPKLIERNATNRRVREAMEADPLSLLHLLPKMRATLLDSLVPHLRSNTKLDATTLKVLVQYRDPAKRALVRDWLRGEALDQADCQTLGNIQERPGDDIDAVEEECRRIILTLGHLFVSCNRSIVVCFDQLDALREKERIAAFGDMFHLLVNNPVGILPVAFIQLAYWQDIFMPALQPTVRERLEMNEFQLVGCDREQARQLIESRIRLVFRDNADRIRDWLFRELGDRIPAGSTPRAVLKTANDFLKQHAGSGETSQDSEEETPSHPEKEAGLAQRFQLECDRISSEWSSRLPDAEILLEALRIFVRDQPFRETETPESRYLAPHGLWTSPDGKEVPCAFVVRTEKHHKSILASLERGIAFLEKHGSGARCFFVTDARIALFPPSWKATNAQRDRFKALGGVLLPLDRAEVARWFALVSLRNMVLEGDLMTGNKPIVEKDFRDYLRNEFTPPLLDPFLRHSAGTSPTPEKEIPERKSDKPEQKNDLPPILVELIKRSPMGSLTVSLILARLEERGIVIDRDSLLQVVGDNKSRFLMIPLQDGFAVMLNRT